MHLAPLQQCGRAALLLPCAPHVAVLAPCPQPRHAAVSAALKDGGARSVGPDEAAAPTQRRQRRQPPRQQGPGLQGPPQRAAGPGPDAPLEARMAALPGMHTRFAPAPRHPHLPTMDCLVVVEGHTDCKAVQQAVNAAVYVCDGDTIKSAAAAQRLRALQQWHGPVVVLTDPDAGGRMLRMFLDDALRQQQPPPSRGTGQQPHGGAGTAPPVLHAFVPIAEATSTVANSRHDVGSVGVENAGPEAIRASLRAAGPSHHARQDFSAQELVDAGFLNAFDSKQVHGAKLRRQVLCNALGIDNCTGGALVTALNRFFTRAQYEEAVRKVDAALQPS